MKFTNFVIVLLCCLFGFAMVNSVAIPDENQNYEQSLMDIVEKVNFYKKLTASEKELLCKATGKERHVVSYLYCKENKINNDPFQKIFHPQSCAKKLKLKIKNICGH